MGKTPARRPRSRMRLDMALHHKPATHALTQRSFAPPGAQTTLFLRFGRLNPSSSYRKNRYLHHGVRRVVRWTVFGDRIGGAIAVPQKRS
jgi:hypothetical protein